MLHRQEVRKQAPWHFNDLDDPSRDLGNPNPMGITTGEEDLNGLRFGTPELVRWGMTAKDSTRLAGLIAKALKGQIVTGEVSEWRKTFNKLHFIH